MNDSKITQMLEDGSLEVICSILIQIILSIVFLVFFLVVIPDIPGFAPFKIIFVLVLVLSIFYTIIHRLSTFSYNKKIKPRLPWEPEPQYDFSKTGDTSISIDDEDEWLE